MKKVIFFLPTLNGGGAERVTVNLINKLSSNFDNLDIHLLLLRKEGVFLSDLNAEINVTDLNSKRTIYSFFKIIKFIKKEKPDYFVSSLNYLNVVSLIIKRITNTHTKFFVTEHSTISQRLNNFSGLGVLVPFLMKKLYNSADHIICVSEGIKIDLLSTLKIRNEKISVIYNFIDFEKINKLKALEVQHHFFKSGFPVIISVGRLIYEKNFDLLIDAFLEVRSKTKCKLIILGEGPFKNILKNKISGSRFNEDIDLVGFQNNPYAWMNKADLFVLSSRTEGLPTVLIEAMAVGCQVISTDCPSGPSEIISNTEGLLVKNLDIDDMVEKINLCLESREKIKYDLSKFNIDSISSKYLKLFY